MIQSTVVGVFEHRAQAERAIEELRRAGFADNQLGLIAPHTGAAGDVPENDAGAGAVTGSIVGTIAGLVLAVGLVPAIGPVVAGGILAEIVSGAATGAVLGGIVGALVGLEVPEHRARYYESEFRAGHTLVTVKAAGRYSEAVALLAGCGARDVDRQRLVSPAGQ